MCFVVKVYRLVFCLKKAKNMTQRDMAGYLGVSTATIRNWRKEKPNLYKIIMQGFAVEDVKKTLQESIEKLENAGEEKPKR